jgi:hypothetical protein
MNDLISIEKEKMIEEKEESAKEEVEAQKRTLEAYEEESRWKVGRA